MVQFLLPLGKPFDHSCRTGHSQSDKVTVQTVGKAGSPSQKTFDVTRNVDVRAIHNRAAKLSDLKSGDAVCVTEKEGKVTKIAEQNGAVIKLGQSTKWPGYSSGSRPAMGTANTTVLEALGPSPPTG